MTQISTLERGLIAHYRLADKFQKVGAEGLTNYNFESYTGSQDDASGDTFTNWAKSETNGYVESSATSEGAGSAKFVKTTSNVVSDLRLVQTFAGMTVGITYRLTIRTRGDGTVSAGYSIYDNSNTAWIRQYVNMGITSTSWTTFTYDFVCTGATMSFYACGSAGIGTSYIDFMSVKPLQIADLTPQGNHATNYGVTFTTDRKGQANMAGSFDGVGDYLSAGDVNDITTNDFTLCAWVKKTSVGEINRIVSKAGGSGTTRWIFGVDSSDRLTGYMQQGGTQREVTSSDTINNTDYYHVGWVCDRDDESRLYINGSEVSGYALQQAPITASLSNSIPYWIGDYYNAGSGSTVPWTGNIDEVRQYNRALSADEVASLYSLYGGGMRL